jgi:hypothetical protein
LGWLDKGRVVAFVGEPDARGDPTWKIDVAEPEPRDGRKGRCKAA